MKNKNLILLIIAVVIAAIAIYFTVTNDHSGDEKPFLKDTSIAIPQNKNGEPADKNVLLSNLSARVLQSLKDSNYKQLTAFFHPRQPVIMSPYGFIDTGSVQMFTATSLLTRLNKDSKIFWGIQNGSGDSIIKTIPEYFSRYVYDADFINAPKRSINHFLAFGNSINNLQKRFPSADFTEYYFPGIDPKYNGLDWRSLRLVFQLYKGQYFLVGLVHDEWSP